MASVEESDGRLGVGTLTRFIERWRDGDRDAESELFERVYPQLRRMARARLQQEMGNPSLQATDLVHEAYEKLVAQRDKNWKNRLYFFAAVTTIMRRILVDHARRRGAQKRGGDIRRVTADDSIAASAVSAELIVAIDEALDGLKALSPRQERIVSMKFFGGLEHDEIAELLEVSTRTVKREWRVARAWLYGALESRA